jgi:hypothetical protein
LDGPAKGDLARETPAAGGPEKAPEQLETIESAPENGIALEASSAPDGWRRPARPPVSTRLLKVPLRSSRRP